MQHGCRLVQAAAAAAIAAAAAAAAAFCRCLPLLYFSPLLLVTCPNGH
jgi:hypothetical protein